MYLSCAKKKGRPERTNPLLCDPSKYSEAYALPAHTANHVSDVLVNQLLSRYGIPRQIILNQGPEFMSDVFTQLCKLLGVEKLNTSPNSPASNGTTELQNLTIQQMLAIYIENRPIDWDKHLPLVNAAYNSTVSSSTGFLPNNLLFGREVNSIIGVQLPRNPSESPTLSCSLLHVQWLQASFHSCQQTARENIKMQIKKLR